MKRDREKRPLLDIGVRKRKVSCRYYEFIIEDQIEIDGACLEFVAAPDPAEFALDAAEQSELQSARIQVRLDFHHTVVEPRLAGRPDWLSAINC